MKKTIQKRTYIIGDEWIYFKIYTGAQTSDRILMDVIRPLVEDLLFKKVIDRWFFIRYTDPDPHIRFRLHLEKYGSLSTIIRKFYGRIKALVDQDLIWKVQIDTYQREIERYGIHTMDLTERFFFLDSTLFLKVLPLFRNPEGEIQRWHFALKSIDCLLDCFKLRTEQKLTLLETLKDNYGKEFGINRSLKDQINFKFSKEWKGIDRSLNPNTENESIISPFLGHLRIHKENLTPLADEINRTLNLYQEEVLQNDLTGSYIHMMMNRIFRSKQRIHELVLYDFLYRYYKSVVARTKKIGETSQTVDQNYENCSDTVDQTGL